MLDAAATLAIDPLTFTNPSLHSLVNDMETRPFFLTKKEHPLIKTTMHFLHECQLNQMFEGDDPAVNRIAKWASVVLPQVFGLDMIGVEVMKKVLML